MESGLENVGGASGKPLASDDHSDLISRISLEDSKTEHSNGFSGLNPNTNWHATNSKLGGPFFGDTTRDQSMAPFNNWARVQESNFPDPFRQISYDPSRFQQGSFHSWQREEEIARNMNSFHFLPHHTVTNPAWASYFPPADALGSVPNMQPSGNQFREPGNNVQNLSGSSRAGFHESSHDLGRNFVNVSTAGWANQDLTQSQAEAGCRPLPKLSADTNEAGRKLLQLFSQQPGNSGVHQEAETGALNFQMNSLGSPLVAFESGSHALDLKGITPKPQFPNSFESSLHPFIAGTNHLGGFKGEPAMDSRYPGVIPSSSNSQPVPQQVSSLQTLGLLPSEGQKAFSDTKQPEFEPHKLPQWRESSTAAGDDRKIHSTSPNPSHDAPRHTKESGELGELHVKPVEAGQRSKFQAPPGGGRARGRGRGPDHGSLLPSQRLQQQRAAPKDLLPPMGSRTTGPHDGRGRATSVLVGKITVPLDPEKPADNSRAVPEDSAVSATQTGLSDSREPHREASQAEMQKPLAAPAPAAAPAVKPLPAGPARHRMERRPRADMAAMNAKLQAVFEQLAPTAEESRRLLSFFARLEAIVERRWPSAKLHLYGSCANSFGSRGCDIDVCLAVGEENAVKADAVARMADILTQEAMDSVQAITHARVPVVKFKDPASGISCDICVNNMLAVTNTRLLKDYARVDMRLRQLVFLVKHWAKQRQINEAYRGTLSSYAYVIMCIHFLQQRQPPVLPCLQGMAHTFSVTIGEAHCGYYDQVQHLEGFGEANKESLAELLCAFFDYWARRHDYNRSVVSIRVGGYLSKSEKEWTKRVGSERHLICIEDPFETSHDLGRVVDRYSIRVIREEFNRAARIALTDPDPCAALFAPYVRGHNE